MSLNVEIGLPICEENEHVFPALNFKPRLVLKLLEQYGYPNTFDPTSKNFYLYAFSLD